MRSKPFVGFLAVVGFLLVPNPVVADAARQVTGTDIENNSGRGAFASSGEYKRIVSTMTRCDVKAIRPRRATTMDPEAYVEGWLTCDPAILPETFNNTVCLQVKTGGAFVDNGCCKVPKTTVGTSPWLMCGEPWALVQGTHQYRTRARAFRPSTGKGETDYSPAVTFTF